LPALHCCLPLPARRARRSRSSLDSLPSTTPRQLALEAFHTRGRGRSLRMKRSVVFPRTSSNRASTPHRHIPRIRRQRLSLALLLACCLAHRRLVPTKQQRLCHVEHHFFFLSRPHCPSASICRLASSMAQHRPSHHPGEWRVALHVDEGHLGDGLLSGAPEGLRNGVVDRLRAVLSVSLTLRIFLPALADLPMYTGRPSSSSSAFSFASYPVVSGSSTASTLLSWCPTSRLSSGSAHWPTQVVRSLTPLFIDASLTLSEKQLVSSSSFRPSRSLVLKTTLDTMRALVQPG
jgi:hypothetical protein